MDEGVAMRHEPAVRKRRGDRPMKALWKRIRKPLAESQLTKGLLAGVLVQIMKFIRLTNPMVAGSARFDRSPCEEMGPAIMTVWHGQHLLMPAFFASRRPLVAMVSRSADAEINALLIERFGIEAVRGSGGRDNTRHLDKGGARALIALKKALAGGKHAFMIADIPHGTPRDAGAGVVLLAKLSGRPIFAAALATSRRKVLERSWDRTVINLPFGRSAMAFGEPIFVSADADDAEMERKRLEVTAQLNAVTAEAYQLVDGGP
jgi:lysophospholipid acyltransferase (LPLAT)-like uncharacterized protein